MKRPFRPSAFRALTVGFTLMILLGAALLMLPVSSKGAPLSPLEAVFTATSASCVTGLSLFDTYTRFTLFGQAVILVMIQIGGLGLMTVASLVSFLLGRRIGLYERSLLMESMGSLRIGGVVRMVRRALIGSAVFEGAGAALLALWFCPRYGFWQGLWLAVFHAVSAFCNAGFDLMGISAPGTSMAAFAGVPLVSLVLMALVLLGGLGFFLWDDVLTHRLDTRHYNLHTKLVLSATVLVTAAGTAGFFLLESRGAFSGASTGQRWLLAAFQSVTTRTAGFAQVDQASLTSGGTLLTMVLMLVGAGSGSTGGGIKINTCAVLALSVAAYVRRREGAGAFHRRIAEESVRRAFLSVGLYLGICLCGAFVLCAQGLGLEDGLFEAVSAIGTVGLSRGVTAALPTVSKWAVIALMFAGRLGSLSVIMAVTTGARQRPAIRNISERVLIG